MLRVEIDGVPYENLTHFNLNCKDLLQSLESCSEQRLRKAPYSNNLITSVF